MGTVFAACDTTIRFFQKYRFGFSYKNVWIIVPIRLMFVPALIACATGVIQCDVAALIFTGLFGISNGFCCSLSLVVINDIPGLSADELNVIGRISAVAVNGGL